MTKVHWTVLQMDYRQYVKLSAVGKIWAMHAPSQKHYDSWHDGWDICPKLTPKDDIDDPWDECDLPDLPAHSSIVSAESSVE